MANRAHHAIVAAGRALATAAWRLWAMERGLKLFLLSVALFLVGLRSALGGAPGVAAVWGALAVASMVACVLTPSPLQRAERARVAAAKAHPPPQPVSPTSGRPTGASGPPSVPPSVPPSPPSGGGARPPAR